MQRGNCNNNHQMVGKTTSFLDDQNVPYDEEISSYNQHKEPTLHGPVHWTNNIQGSIPNPFEDNPQSQISSNVTPENAAWSEAPPALVREHDFYMPVANIVRIMRRALPPHAKVADEAKERVQEYVSEFISFITSEANETCQLEHRKTITAEDIIGAMSKLGFHDYIQPLSLYLQKHRESDMYTSVPRRSVGNISTEATATATALLPKNTVLPPYTMVHPHFAMFNRGPYYDGSGTSSDPITTGQGQGLDTATTTTINGTGPNLALGIGGGSSGNENGGQYRSSQAGFGPYNRSGNYK